MQYFVTLDGKLMPPPFRTLDAAKDRAEEHIRAGTRGEIAVDCYQDDTKSPVKTTRYNRTSKSWS